MVTLVQLNISHCCDGSIKSLLVKSHVVRSFSEEQSRDFLGARHLHIEHSSFSVERTAPHQHP